MLLHRAQGEAPMGKGGESIMGPSLTYLLTIESMSTGHKGASTIHIRPGDGHTFETFVEGLKVAMLDMVDPDKGKRDESARTLDTSS